MGTTPQKIFVGIPVEEYDKFVYRAYVITPSIARYSAAASNDISVSEEDLPRDPRTSSRLRRVNEELKTRVLEIADVVNNNTFLLPDDVNASMSYEDVTTTQTALVLSVDGTENEVVVDSGRMWFVDGRITAPVVGGVGGYSVYKNNTLYNGIDGTDPLGNKFIEGICYEIGTGIVLTNGDKGDITVSNVGLTWTIDNNVVTYAKMQDVSATDKILGRKTAGSGDPEEIDCTAAGRAILDDASASDQRTTLGATTVGGNFFTLTNPSAVTWPRMNADNSITARTAAQTKTDLGLVIGTDVQAWDADLDALAALSGTNTIYYRSAANTWSAVTIGTNLTFSAGTLAASSTMDITGLTATDTALDDYIPEYDTSAAANRKISVTRLGAFILPSIFQARLTATTGDPTPTADATSVGTIYLTPYQGNRIAIYDGTRWNLYALTEISLSLSVTSGSVYDVFIYDNSGTLTLELSSAWTTTTSRANALTTQDGIYVKSGATTRRWVGTIYASGTNQVTDSATIRGVWNYYNQIERRLQKTETTNSWSTSNTSWHEWNGSTANRVQFVQGITQEVFFEFWGLHSVSGTGTAAVGICLDNVNANDANLKLASNSSSSILCLAGATYRKDPGLGYHYLQLTEKAGSSSTTFYGDINSPNDYQYGAIGYMWG